MVKVRTLNPRKNHGVLNDVSRPLHTIQCGVQVACVIVAVHAKHTANLIWSRAAMATRFEAKAEPPRLELIKLITDLVL
jgi:hypothetical protein